MEPPRRIGRVTAEEERRQGRAEALVILARHQFRHAPTVDEMASALGVGREDVRRAIDRLGPHRAPGRVDGRGRTRRYDRKGDDITAA